MARLIRRRSPSRIAAISQQLVFRRHSLRSATVVERITYMSAGRRRFLARVPSAMGLVARLAYAQARARGIPVRLLLEKAGLSSKDLEDPRTRLSTRKQIEFLNLVAEALGDEMMGFHLALEVDLRRGGLLYYVLGSSDTLREVFERGARFTAIVNEGVIQQFIDGRRVGLALRYMGVQRLEDRHQIEFWLSIFLRMCRQFTGVNLKPAQVRMTHYRGRGHAQLSRFLGCKVEFGAPVDQILFAREAAQMPLTAADPYLNRLLVEVCEQTLASQRRASESFVARVENAVAPLLPHGTARAAKIAVQFGMSERTLTRRLADEGVTFTQLVDTSAARSGAPLPGE